MARHETSSSSSSNNNHQEKNNNKINIDSKNNANLDNIVNAVGSKADKESENIDLAGNLAQGSKGEKGIGVVEAPKGGIANEAPIVGTDEDELVGTGGNKAKNAGKKDTKLQSVMLKIMLLLVKGFKNVEGVDADSEDAALANKIANENNVQQVMEEN